MTEEGCAPHSSELAACVSRSSSQSALVLKMRYSFFSSFRVHFAFGLWDEVSVFPVPPRRCGGGERGAPGNGEAGTEEGEDAASGLSRAAQEDVRLRRVHLLGDGRLNYRRENILEAYYNTHLWRGLYAALDFQHVSHPGDNRDCGPVNVGSFRLHLDL
jgi:hypothetical protein